MFPRKDHLPISPYCITNKYSEFERRRLPLITSGNERVSWWSICYVWPEWASLLFSSWFLLPCRLSFMLVACHFSPSAFYVYTVPHTPSSSVLSPQTYWVHSPCLCATTSYIVPRYLTPLELALPPKWSSIICPQKTQCWSFKCSLF